MSKSEWSLKCVVDNININTYYRGMRMQKNTKFTSTTLKFINKNYTLKL